jgi:hypothetical protein
MELVNSSYSVGFSAGDSVEELGSRIVVGAGRLAAATCRWLLLVAAFDTAQGYASFGLTSTAQWLTHACGIATRTATDQVRVATCVAAHPALAAQMTAGRLSARLDPERGATVAAALDTIARAEQVTAADALVRLAEIALAALADEANPAPRATR